VAEFALVYDDDVLGGFPPYYDGFPPDYYADWFGHSYWDLWYQSDYVPGEAEAPDCASSDGVTPDSGDAKQSPVCASCPHAEWGSDGKGQACKQGKTMYVVPAGDPDGDVFQLRIAPTSLKPMANYGAKLIAGGLNPATVITALGQAEVTGDVD